MNNPPITLTNEELTLWLRYIYEISGIHLDESKAYLIETRLSTLLRETNSSSFTEFLDKVKKDFSANLRIKIINLITTNETSFFRDITPFDLLKFKLIPEIIDRRSKSGIKPLQIRILSAACSSGQEIYSVAITLKELLISLHGYDIRIFGLDISDAVIAQASYGSYSKLDLDRGLTPQQIDAHFMKEKDKDRWRVKDELRSLATFKRANLFEPIISPTPFDIIFCRNVAIYFNIPDRIRLFKNLGRVLAPDGALIIGSTESISNICPEFESKRHLRSVYYNIKR